MNGLRMQTVRLDIYIKPVNINLLSASFVPIIPVFLFSLFFFLSTRRNIHFLPFKPGWYLNRTIVFLHSLVSREKKYFPRNIPTIHWQFSILVTWLNLPRYLMYHFSTCTIFKTRPEFNPADWTNFHFFVQFLAVEKYLERRRDIIDSTRSWS